MTLFCADYAYSSWSLRGFLAFDGFGVPYRMRISHMKTPEFVALQDEMAPSRTVPALKISSENHADVIVWDSLAVFETVAEHFPEAGHWPADPAARAVARSVVAEMHSGFTALRSACPMNMRRAYSGFEVPADVAADLARLSEIWAAARAVATAEGPFLFGPFTLADAAFAPVASRIVTYDLPLRSADAAYVAALNAHPAVRRWRSMAFADDHVAERYERALSDREDPLMPDLFGTEVVGARPLNTHCPFSGKPVAADSLVQIGTAVIGFCNPFCRDKVAADPMAWPAAMALLPDGAV